MTPGGGQAQSMREWVGAYVMGVLIAIDQLGNAIAGGYPDEMISSRLGKAKLRAQREGRELRWWARWLDRFLDWLDPYHSIDAIEHDEGDPVQLAPGAQRDESDD